MSPAWSWRWGCALHTGQPVGDVHPQGVRSRGDWMAEFRDAGATGLRPGAPPAPSDGSSTRSRLRGPTKAVRFHKE